MSALLAISALLFIAQFRFLNVFMHSDCSNLRYPSYFYANKELTKAEFTGMTGHLGNKIIVYYINALAYWLFPKKSVSAPKIIYAVYLFFSSISFFSIMYNRTNGGVAALGLVIYLLLSTYPWFYVFYDSVEKYAHLPIFIVLACLFSNSQQSAFILGFMGPVLLFLFKPTYIIEWVPTFAYKIIAGDILAATTGILLSIFLTCLFAIYRRGDLREFKGYYSQFLSNGLFLYVFRNRKPQNKQAGSRRGLKQAEKNWQNTMTRHLKAAFCDASLFRKSALTGLGLTILSFFSLSHLSVGQPLIIIYLMLIGSILSFLIQFRFFGYHYIPFVPYCSILFCFLAIDPIENAIALIIWSLFLTWILIEHVKMHLLSSSEVNQAMFSAIPHYQKRNEASVIIAKKLNIKKGETLLQWGEASQLNLLAGALSPAGNDEIAPWHTDLYPYKLRYLLDNCIATPPKYMILMINNLNWTFFTQITGLEYHLESLTYIDDEVFPVYKYSSRKPIKCRHEEFSDRQLSGSIYLPCRYISPEGRRIWNRTLHGYSIDQSLSEPRLNNALEK